LLGPCVVGTGPWSVGVPAAWPAGSVRVAPCTPPAPQNALLPPASEKHPDPARCRRSPVMPNGQKREDSLKDRNGPEEGG
jgi:hypothetical protein